MNNIPLTKDGDLVLNANDGAGNWNDAAKDKYKVDGDMEKMFDTTVEADKVIAYNLFPQTATNGTSASTTDVKTSMPHFVLKLTTKANGTPPPPLADNPCTESCGCIGYLFRRRQSIRTECRRY